jgi:XTP/dITP diphosphohydrolase
VKQYVRRVVEALEPERVLLFGSVARGDYHEASDVDIMVIKDWDEPLLDRVSTLLSLRVPGLPLEPIGYTAEELSRMVRDGNPFILDALAHGKELYRRGLADTPVADRTLLLATGNAGKARELVTLLQGVPLQMMTLSDLGIRDDVAEAGSTYEENATHKALVYALRSGLWALAEDSGLEVDALGGEPGPRSKGYAGEGASDAQRVQYLLGKLREVPQERRGARFCSVIGTASPQGQVRTFHGECRGVIALEPRGRGGFGYDPVFTLPAIGKTMAELSTEEKNRVSHRGDAARKAVEFLKALGRE